MTDTCDLPLPFTLLVMDAGQLKECFLKGKCFNWATWQEGQMANQKDIIGSCDRTGPLDRILMTE